MALRRRRWKFPLARHLKLLRLVIVPLLSSGSLAAAPSELVVADGHTGLAIYGFDPVAYFTDGKPVSGRSKYELELADAIWRFRSDGNREAFSDNPDIYLPRYGGYDPIALARGVAVAGNPTLWLIVGERLYFFYTPQAQQAFAANPQDAIAAADEHWPEVKQGLVR